MTTRGQKALELVNWNDECCAAQLKRKPDSKACPECGRMLGSPRKMNFGDYLRKLHESWRIHLEAFIVSQGLEDKGEEYKEAVAEEEMDESQPGWDAEEDE